MSYLIYLCFFFFSSRRRHTRLVSEWSSDVCSSDLCVMEREMLFTPIDSATRAASPCSRSVGRPEGRLETSKSCQRRSEEHTSELQSLTNLVCRLLLEKKNRKNHQHQKTN